MRCPVFLKLRGMEKNKRFWTEQRKRDYIRNAEDNLFIIAGPGTGKTTLLSRRILNQIMGGERLSHFLLIAFTEEAVEEFKQKIKKHLYREIAVNKEASRRLKKKVHGIDRMHIMTFHAFCLFVLEKGKGSETEQEGELPVEEQCLRLLKRNQALLQELRRDFSKIYADELQDLNRVQLEILLRLSMDRKGKMRHNCLFMVGDPRQTIYQDAEEGRQVFFEMKKKMEARRNVRVLYLNENYRANKQLVDWINASFREKMRSYRDMEASQKADFLKHCPIHGVYRREVFGGEGESLKALLLALHKAYPSLSERDFLVLCKSKERSDAYREILKDIPFLKGSSDKVVLEARYSKGLNANIVILTGAGAGQESRREERDNHLLHLEYVAVTRAKHALLFLTGEDEGWFQDKEYKLEELPVLSPIEEE